METARLPRNACTRLWEELLALYLHSKTALIRQICGECLMCRANDNNDGCCHKDDKRQHHQELSGSRNTCKHHSFEDSVKPGFPFCPPDQGLYSE